MARDYTPYQKGVIKRYYEHAESAALQKLGEIVSDLYLATSDAQKERLWKRAEAALGHLECPRGWKEAAVAERSLEGLAELLTHLQG